ncbi:MAG: cob(I)yrinic acid a,c-diamide adenosyltransferase [Planctomycetota bacterium]|jgi:cob(I)alamin adenosyltransferase|nr:cob(I)yrinic acid a,c-diamide adenosyltransferase [Planctomycetota bacterium]
MVRIDRVSTRTGDGGSTRLGDGTQVSKSDWIMEAVGLVDAANCTFGVALCEEMPEGLPERLRACQNDLFDVGSDLVMPPGGPHEDKIPRLTAAYVDRLELWAEEAQEVLAPLTSFVLPGGSRAAAALHQCRVTVRAAERAVVRARPEMSGREEGPLPLAIYLNRLSDLCFQWSRMCNDNGKTDILWEPGRGS